MFRIAAMTSVLLLTLPAGAGELWTCAFADKNGSPPIPIAFEINGRNMIVPLRAGTPDGGPAFTYDLLENSPKGVAAAASVMGAKGDHIGIAFIAIDRVNGSAVQGNFIAGEMQNYGIQRGTCHALK